MSKFFHKTLIVLLFNLIIGLSLTLSVILWYDWPNYNPDTTQQEPFSIISHPENNLADQVIPQSTITTDPESALISTSQITLTVSAIAEASPPSAATPTEVFPPALRVPSRIMASAINLDSPVTEMGWALKENAEGNLFSDWVIPEFAAGWHINSMVPGHGGNTVLSGHHNVGAEVFRDLIELETGDEIIIEAGNIHYEYTVEEKYIVKEEGVSEEVRRANYGYIEPTSDERLTLVTCWPYESNSHRVIIIARPGE